MNSHKNPLSLLQVAVISIYIYMQETSIRGLGYKLQNTVLIYGKGPLHAMP